MTKELTDESIYGKLSEERKELQKQGLAPSHWSTGSYQLFKEKYQYDVENPRQQYERIAKTLAKYSPDSDYWEKKFFDVMWNGWLSPSTPVLSNTGTNRGFTVSCQGSHIGDSIDEIYKTKHEIAMLTKKGFGTSAYLGDIRPRGAPISGGGKSLGILPVIKGFQSDMEYVAQGSSRRGSWAGYVPMFHGDFDEVCSYLVAEPDGNNIGWIIYDDDLKSLQNRDSEALRRYKKMLRTKMITGKGYFFFPDKVNRKLKPWMTKHNLFVKSSNLCSEITLHSSDEYSFTCVLASLNLSLYDDWKDTDLVKTSIVFLDCVASDFIANAKNVPGMEKVVAFTEKSRALGLGVLGFHSYLQSKMIAFESFEAHLFNNQVFLQIKNEAEEATKWLAEELGEPEFCKGFNRRNTHLLAIAPTKSTALLMGGASEGINPDPAMVFTQKTPAGEIDRVNPYLLKIMKDRKVYTPEIVHELRTKYYGSVQHVDWLTDEEKLVFRTAFEINQHVILRLAAFRGKNLDQWQSLNLFFAADESEKVINEVHREAFLNEDILALYYVYGSRGNKTIDNSECIACS